MRKLSNVLIIISNIFWSELLYWDFKMDLVKVNEPLGYEFGIYLVLIFAILILWLPFFKSRHSKKWAIVGIVMNVFLISPFAIVGYILRCKSCPRKIKSKQLEIIE